MSWFSDIGDWFSDNSGWLKPVTKFVGNIAGNTLQSGNQDAYLDALRNAEDKNYADAKALYDAQMAHLMANSGGGDGGAGAAARANEANRVKAAKKALKKERKGFREIRDLYKPFADTSRALLPGMESLYNQGASNLTKMNPQFLAAEMNASKPAFEIDVPIPSYLVGRKA